MGLDNLIDDENEEQTNNQSEWSSSTLTDDSDDFSGPFVQKDTGMYGYESKNKYKDTVVGEMKLHGDLFKYQLPIFPHIENEQMYSFGGRYTIENKNNIIVIGGIVSCIYMRNVRLDSIPRELIMLDTGNTEKEDCYSVLEERFDKEINDNTSVCLHLFLRTRHITKMAIGDEQVSSWSTYPKDRLLKAVFGETYTQEFRETAGGPPNLKHTDQIGIWGSADEFGVDDK